MKVIITKDYDEMSKEAYELVRAVILDDPACVLGLATGSSPIGLYRELTAAYERGELSFKGVRSVNLDEYVGLKADHVQSYHYFMRENLFGHVDIDPANTNLPDGSAADLDAECRRYNALLEGMKQDVQVLGIGSNGHIGFNEPGTAFDSLTHIVRLTESTIRDNSRLFADISEVPTRAITMGIANIMNAKSIVVVANGENKADAVYKMVKGEVTEAVPASVLQRHADVTLVCDEKAAAGL